MSSRVSIYRKLLGRVHDKKNGFFALIRHGKQYADKKDPQSGATCACSGANGAQGSSNTASCTNGAWPGV